MSYSFNCLLLGETSFEKIFQVTVSNDIISDDTNVPISIAQVGQFKSHILSKKKYKFSIDDPDVMNLWKVEINIGDENKVKDVFTVEDIKRKREELKAEFMNPADRLMNDYFSSGPLEKHVHIIIAVLTFTGKYLPTFYLSNKKFLHFFLLHCITFANTNTAQKMYHIIVNYRVNCYW
jgi:hypothetical protein